MSIEIICGIYKITSPSNSIYIGQSNNCYYRRRRYRNAECKGQQRLYKSIIKYGWEAHEFDIIYVCPKEELNFWEKYYVDLYDTFDTPHGLNLVDGGGSKGSPSKETRKRSSVALKSAYINGVKQRPIGEINGMFGNGYKLLGEKNGRYGMEVSQITRDKIRESNSKAWETIKGTDKDKETRSTWRQSKMETLRKNGKKYLGIHERKQKHCMSWYIMIHINGKNTYFGTYTNEEEAVSVYNEAAKKHFGEFALLNEYKP